MRMHLAEKQFRCKSCQKSFTSKYYLNKRNSIDTEDKALICFQFLTAFLHLEPWTSIKKITGKTVNLYVHSAITYFLKPVASKHINATVKTLTNYQSLEYWIYRKKRDIIWLRRSVNWKIMIIYLPLWKRVSWSRNIRRSLLEIKSQKKNNPSSHHGIFVLSFKDLLCRQKHLFILFEALYLKFFCVWVLLCKIYMSPAGSGYSSQCIKSCIFLSLFTPRCQFTIF